MRWCIKAIILACTLGGVCSPAYPEPIRVTSASSEQFIGIRGNRLVCFQGLAGSIIRINRASVFFPDKEYLQKILIPRWKSKNIPKSKLRSLISKKRKQLQNRQSICNKSSTSGSSSSAGSSASSESSLPNEPDVTPTPTPNPNQDNLPPEEHKPTVTFFIDGHLLSDCTGNYSIALRDCSGTDGDAFKKLEDLTGYYLTTTSYVSPKRELIPGALIYIREGSYRRERVQNTNVPAAFTIRSSGTHELPISFVGYPGEQVVLRALSLNNNSRFYSALSVEADNLIIKNLSFTEGIYSGLRLGESGDIKANMIMVSKCKAFNNYGNSGAGGHVAGFLAKNGSRIVFDHLDSYMNGISETGSLGGSGVGVELGGDPLGDLGGNAVCVECEVKNSLLYNNKWASGGTNSADGLATKSAWGSLFFNNVAWGNDEDGFDMTGCIGCRLHGNVAIANNTVGFKANVWGGGANVFQNNLAVMNGAFGLDEGRGVGNIWLQNVAYKNRGWGLVVDAGARLALFANNISAFNNTLQSNQEGDFFPCNNLSRNNPFFCMLFSDHNFTAYQSDLNDVRSIQMGSANIAPGAGNPHFDQSSLSGTPEFLDPEISIVDSNSDGLLSPEEMFPDSNSNGVITSEDAILWLSSKFSLKQSSPAIDAGIDHQNLLNTAASFRADMISATQELRSKFPSHQQRWANWGRLIDFLQKWEEPFISWYLTLEQTDIIGLPKRDGNMDSVSTWDLGAIERQ